MPIRFDGGKILFGPSVADPLVDQILMHDGPFDPYEDCCCCDCTLAEKAYTDGPWECISADDGAPSYKSTVTFTLSGTPVSRSAWVFSGGSWFNQCTGVGPPDPTGSWVFSLPAGTLTKIYESITLVCSDPGTNYYDYVCMVFQANNLVCGGAAAAAEWSYVTFGMAYPKTDPQPSVDGWTLRGSNCILSGSNTQGYRKLSPVDYAGFQTDYYQKGAYVVGGVTRYCKSSCNLRYCRPSCGTAYSLLLTNDTNSIIHNGVDYSGISVGVAFT